MRLFLVRGDPALNLLQPVPDGVWQWRGGVAVAEWTEVSFRLLTGAEHEFIAADCLTMNTGADGFLVSEYAREVLIGPLEGIAEFWPVSVLGERYWWMNCLASAAVLDRERTDADWGMVEGGWGSFRWITTTRRLAFNASRLQRGPMLFRIPEYPQGVLFAGERFRALVDASELTGFSFDQVWSSEDGGVLDPPGVGFGRMFNDTPESVAARRAKVRAAVLLRRAGDASAD